MCLIKFLKKFLNKILFLTERFFFHIYNILKYKSLFIPKKNCASKRLLNKKVFVIGAGPSIKKDLNKIRSIGENDEIFVTNYFALTPLWNELKPRNYLLADPGLWNDQWENTHLEEKNIDLYKALNKVEWGINLYIPENSLDYIKIKIKNKSFINIINFPIRSSYLSNINHRSNMISNYIVPPNICNGCLVAIWISIMSNAQSIYLYGLDSDGFKNLETDQETNAVKSGSMHFYDKKYIPEKKKKTKFLYQRFKQIYVMFREFQVLSILGKKKDIKIKNLSSYSMIDSFERG